jgi:hypothetical protein
MAPHEDHRINRGGRTALRILTAAALFATTGCAITPTFTAVYPFDRQALRAAPLDATLAVERFDDQRSPRKYTTQGRTFLTYVPLIPYVTLDFERLDETVPMLSDQIEVPGEAVSGAVQNRAPAHETYSYPQSMARAIATDLEAHGLFRTVSYVGDTAASDAFDYVLSGTLRATPIAQHITSYLLGMPGVLLWLLPLPVVKSEAAVVLDLTLTETRTQRVVWEETIESDLSRIDMLYTSQGLIYGGGVFSYSMIPPPADAQVDRDSIFAWHFEALRRGMEKARPSLAAVLAARREEPRSRRPVGE